MAWPAFRWMYLLGIAAALSGITQFQALAAAEQPEWLRLALSSDDGLPNNTVVGLAQGQDGFIWLGTPNGLSRFDGLRFEEFASTNFITPPNRGIVALTRGHSGGLVLGMDRGAIVSLRPGHAEVFMPEGRLSLLTIYSLLEDSEGAVWVSYRDGTVGRLQKGKMAHFTGEHGLPAGPMICSITADSSGRLWAMKNGQLFLWKNGEFQKVLELPRAVARLAPARDGGLWICAESHLYHLPPRGEIEDRGLFKSRLQGVEPSVLMEAHDGAVWVGTAFGGLFRYSDSGFRHVPTTHQEILALLEDNEGTIWTGTGGGGLNQIRRRALTLETSAAGVPFEDVQSICEDSKRVIWATMQNGTLLRRVGNEWTTIPRGGSWNSDATAVCADANGSVWVGTRFHRLACWRDGRFVSWGDPASLHGQTINTLLAATNGDLWIGEDSPPAVQRLHQGTVINYELPPEFSVIRACAQDAAGTVWFGTSRGLLLRVEGERLVDETPRTTGEPQSIRGLCAAPDGSLWIAYAGGGVGRYKAGKFKAFTSRDGLYDDFVSQILLDDEGWLWFGGNRGIFKVRQQDFDSVACGAMWRLRSIHYGPAEYGQGEARPSLQASFGKCPMALRSEDGRLWLAMRTGLLVVDPTQIDEAKQPPAVLVRRIRTGEQVIAAYGGLAPMGKGSPVIDLAGLKGPLRLPPDHRRLEVEFTAVCFVGPENVAFRYQLEGVDENWVESSQRIAPYPRLPAGHYRFRVMACNSEGVWNEAGAGLALIVEPFFWQTWWFRGSMLLAFTGFLIATVRYVSFRRLRSQLQALEAQAALHKERARIAKDIHDDLGASLTQISLIGELAQQDRATPHLVSNHVDRMSSTARMAIKSLDEIVWAVNPRNDTLAHFIDYAGQYALDYSRLAGIRCRLDLPDQAPARELSTDVRHNLFLVVKEAINNSVKHAQASELRLHICVEADKLSIVVEDNGRGFDQPSDSATADGLRNMRQRMADIGGACNIEGRPGTGTRVCLDLPWAVNHSRN
jgi:signal transduction histidine kinase/ligand-binding sensor domain-containing protein